MRNIPKLLSALFALGCGSGAMASTDHGQWTDPTYDSQNPNNGPNNGPSNPYQSAPTGDDQWRGPNNQPPSQGNYDDQDQSQSQSQAQAQPPQSQAPSQAPSQNQDQDEDTADAQIRETGQGHLGVLVMQLTPELRKFFGVTSDRGVLVARVEPHSAASRAGVQVGDVLTRVDGRQVRSGEDVVQALAARQGDRVRIALVRQGRMVRLSASLPGNRAGTHDQDTDRL